LNFWQEAVLEYRSQLVVLGDAMSTPEKAKETLHSYWAEHRGIRLLQIDS
jgi:hypothetical protein